MDSDSSSHSNSELISELANDYLDRCRQGERPPLSEYIERHPELEQGIRDVLPMLLIIEENAADQTSAQRLHSMQPEKLGDFVIGRELGRGGMGIVYEAVQESLGRHVALKVCSLTPGMSSSNRERFRRESRAAALLHHTNIVPVFAVGEEDGLLYYAMQHIRGATLEDVIQELRLVWKDSARATARLSTSLGSRCGSCARVAGRGVGRTDRRDCHASHQGGDRADSAGVRLVLRGILQAAFEFVAGQVIAVAQRRNRRFADRRAAMQNARCHDGTSRLTAQLAVRCDLARHGPIIPQMLPKCNSKPIYEGCRRRAARWGGCVSGRFCATSAGILLATGFAENCFARDAT